MPRILHVIASVAATSGGPSTAMWNMLEALRRQGIDAELATTQSNDERLLGPIATPFNVDSHRVHFFPRQTGFYTASRPMLQWLWKHVGEYDVIHAHGLFSFAPIAAAWCARKHGVPYVIRPAGVLNRWGRSQRRPFVKSLSLRMIEGPLLRDAARVHFTTPSEMEEAKELNLPLRSALIPLGIDTDAMLDGATAGVPDNVLNHECPNDVLQNDEWSDLGSRPTILYLSRIDPVKRLDLLLEAFAALLAKHPTACLLIAGDGPAALKEALQQLATRLSLDANVRWLGFVDGARKRRLLERADVFVLPSFSENFGIALIEAMAAGTPVIASNGVGIAWLVSDTDSGIVFDGTKDKLRQAMEHLLGNKTLREQMGRAAKRAVGKELSLGALGDRLNALYASVVR